MRRRLVLVTALFLLAGCGDEVSGSASPASTSPGPSATPTSETSAGPLEPFDVDGACERYCEQLQAAPKTDCASPPDAYWQCGPFVEELRLAISDVQRITPPDVAYDDLEAATTSALEAITEYTDTGCTEQQAGDADVICGLDLATVRTAAGTVGLALSIAP